MTRTFAEIKAEMMADPEFKAEYERLSLEGLARANEDGTLFYNCMSMLLLIDKEIEMTGGEIWFHGWEQKENFTDLIVRIRSAIKRMGQEDEECSQSPRSTPESPET